MGSGGGVSIRRVHGRQKIGGKMIQAYKAVNPDELEKGQVYTAVFAQPKNALTIYSVAYTGKRHNEEMAECVDAPLYSFAAARRAWDGTGKPIVFEMTAGDVRECVKADAND
jgi:hypothetical protein